MNRSTNNFRRCDYCPHQQQKKQCCCQNRQSFHSVKTKVNINSRGKSNKHKKKQQHIDSSAISYINSTLPITNNSLLPHLNSNILAQNSILRTQNDYLKRGLQTQHYYPSVSTSAFMKDDRYSNNISTLPTSENDTARTHQLHDKLYTSNRNLQEALIQLDTLSRSNKQLNQLNTKLELEKQQLRITNQEMYEECQRLRKKNKRMTKAIQSMPNQQDVHKIINDNKQLRRANAELNDQIQELREQLRQEIKRRNSKSRLIVEVDNLSPQWVANTSSKINAIQKNLIKLQQEQKQNTSLNSVNNSCYFHTSTTLNRKQSCKNPQQDPLCIKPQLISTIKLLKLQSQPFKLTSSFLQQFSLASSKVSVNTINNNNNNSQNNSNNVSFLGGPSLLFLIKALCQSMMQPLFMAYCQLQRDMDKNLKMQQSKFNKIVQKLQNFVIKINNQRLKDKNRSWQQNQQQQQYF